MAGQAQVIFVFFVGISLVQNGYTDTKLRFDQALLTVSSYLSETTNVFYTSEACHKCLPMLLETVYPSSSGVPSNVSVVISSRFPLTLKVFTGRNLTNFACRWRHLYGAQGRYLVVVKRDTAGRNQSEVSCTLIVQKDLENSYIPLLIAFAVFVVLILLYVLGSYVSKFSLTLMIFVNYGGGGYWFFEHAAWNGLTVADLVMAWFVFIIGTSVALAFYAMLKRGVSRIQLVRKLIWRTVVLFVIGVCFLNYGPMDGPLSWSWVRIPGVLQRLAFTYFILALMQTCFGLKDLDNYQFGNWWASFRDVVLYWPEWIIIAALETLWLCLTFLLPVPGCPRGYIGPGGIGDDGKYPNCTGGAAGYIDKWLLGENHLYHHPTCKELYKTSQPFDPEGILGTINSIVMAFFGLQAGKIILMYRQKPQSILKRFLIWALLMGIISAILSKCTQNEGFIPINKNLWSLSYVTSLSSFSFVLLGIMFYVIDVKNWWGGQPFIFPGMNSIFVYVGHSLLGSYFPFSWEMEFPTSHTELLFQNLLGTSIWVFIAYLLYRKKFFLKI